MEIDPHKQLGTQQKSACAINNYQFPKSAWKGSYVTGV